MNKLMILILLAGFGFSAMASEPVTSEPKTTESTFTLVKSKNNIDIYSRWIPVTEKRSARQIQVKFSIDAPIDEALSIILNDNEFTTWMKGTCESRRVQTADQNHWVSYVRFSIPWPLNDQDCIIKYALNKHNSTYYEVSIDGDPEYLNPIDGVNRISHMTGSWKLVQTGPNRTLIEYTIFSNQPSSFPKWITDPIIQNNMVHTMTAFREKVENK